MPLTLDRRQRAMLAEMGVRVWQPLPVAEAPPAPEAAPAAAPMHTPAASRAPTPAPRRTPDPQPAPAAPAALQPLPDLAACDWAALQAAAQQCRGCGLHAGRKYSVWDAAGAALAAAAPAADLPRWLFVTDPPTAAENARGQALQGDAGRLLGQMAAALRLQAAQVYRSHTTKCAPPEGSNAPLEAVACCAAFLQREIALIQPQVIVALGRNAAFGLLQRTEPLGQLRGQPHHVAVARRSVPVIVSYPLGYLLRNPAAKAQAWLDLGRALVAADGPQAAPLQ